MHLIIILLSITTFKSFYFIRGIGTLNTQKNYEVILIILRNFLSHLIFTRLNNMFSLKIRRASKYKAISPVV